MLCFKPYEHLQTNNYNTSSWCQVVQGFLSLHRRKFVFMNSKYIFLLLEYSMCFTLCGYQMDITLNFP